MADQWGNEDGSQQAGIDAFWDATVNKKQRTYDPAQLSQWGVTKISDDKYRLANGQTVDTIRDIGGPNEAVGQWTISGGQNGQNGQNVNWAADPSGQTQFSSGGAGGAAPVAAPAPAADPLRDQLVKQLMARSQQSLGVDANDPTIRAQADPYAANVERSRRNYLADTAERSSPLANLQGEARVSAERAGQASGLFESQLIGREIESRRAEIQDALTQMRGMLTNEQAISLQRELAQLDDATKRLGLSQQQSQFGDALGLQYNQFDWQRDPANPNNIPNFNG